MDFSSGFLKQLSEGSHEGDGILKPFWKEEDSESNCENSGKFDSEMEAVVWNIA